MFCSGIMDQVGERHAVLLPVCPFSKAADTSPDFVQFKIIMCSLHKRLTAVLVGVHHYENQSCDSVDILSAHPSTSASHISFVISLALFTVRCVQRNIISSTSRCISYCRKIAQVAVHKLKLNPWARLQRLMVFLFYWLHYIPKHKVNL